MFLLGFAIFLISMILTVILLGGAFLDFVNLPSLLFIVVPLLGVLTATKSLKVFFGGLKVVINPYRPLPEELRGQAASLFRLLSKTTAIVVALVFLISLIILLVSLDFTDPNIGNTFRGNIAAALITPFYGMLLIVAFFEPVVFILKKRRDTEKK